MAHGRLKRLEAAIPMTVVDPEPHVRLAPSLLNTPGEVEYALAAPEPEEMTRPAPGSPESAATVEMATVQLPSRPAGRVPALKELPPTPRLPTEKVTALADDTPWPRYCRPCHLPDHALRQGPSAAFHPWRTHT